MKAVLPFSFLIVLGTAVSARPRRRQRRQPDCGSGEPAPRPASSRPRHHGSRRRSPVAVVDISYIFKNHEGFKAAMERMKKEVEAYEEHLRTQQSALLKEKERLNDFRPGTTGI